MRRRRIARRSRQTRGTPTRTETSAETCSVGAWRRPRAPATNLAKAAALYDEVVAHYTVVVGSGHRTVKANKSSAARLRAALA